MLVLSDLTRALPGLLEKVRCPALGSDTHPERLWPWGGECGEPGIAISTAIMHLNDECGWSREQIADWLETLDVDLTFPTEPVVSEKQTLRQAYIYGGPPSTWTSGWDWSSTDELWGNAFTTSKPASVSFSITDSAFSSDVFDIFFANHVKSLYSAIDAKIEAPTLPPPPPPVEGLAWFDPAAPESTSKLPVWDEFRTKADTPFNPFPQDTSPVMAEPRDFSHLAVPTLNIPKKRKKNEHKHAA